MITTRTLLGVSKEELEKSHPLQQEEGEEAEEKS
jgi:hypothetical protein